MAELDPATVSKFEGRDVKVERIIGPLVASNGSEFWLIKCYLNGKCLGMSLSQDDGEFIVCRRPITTEWGWDRVGKQAQVVCYAFAQAVSNALEASND